jgi:hypothetical protein
MQNEKSKLCKGYYTKMSSEKEIKVLSDTKFVIPLFVVLLGLASFAQTFFYIPAKKSGHVTLKTGAELQAGQLIGRNLESGSQRGPQGKLLTPGIGQDFRYPLLMDIEIVEDLVVKTGFFAVLKAKDGAMNPKIVAPVWGDDINSQKMIEDFNYFIENGGTRGVQQYLLTTGNYRINQYQWDIEMNRLTSVDSSEVLVVESRFGKSPNRFM